MSLSSEILDDIDGAEETKGRDSRLTDWAARAQILEEALRAIAAGGEVFDLNRTDMMARATDALRQAGIT